MCSWFTANITATVDDRTLTSLTTMTTCKSYNCILKSKLLFWSCFKTFFICTFNASKVTFSRFLFEWRIASSFCWKTAWTDVKFLDGSVFENWIRNECWFSAHPYFLQPSFLELQAGMGQMGKQCSMSLPWGRSIITSKCAFYSTPVKNQVTKHTNAGILPFSITSLPCHVDSKPRTNASNTSRLSRRLVWRNSVNAQWNRTSQKPKTLTRLVSGSQAASTSTST